MASPSLPLLPYLLTSFLLFLSLLLTPTTSSSSTHLNPNNVQSICHFTPYPASCLESQKFTISIGGSTNPSILTSALCSLQAAISYATKLSSLLSCIAPGPNLVESQKSSLQDCRDLHQITLSSLKKSLAELASSTDDSICNLADVRAYLSAALTNKATCLEGLTGARGSLKPSLVESWTTAYEHVSNSLDLVARLGPRRPGARRRRLLSSTAGSDGFPVWVPRRDRRLLQSDDDGEYGPSSVVTVAADGTGNFTTVGEAIAFAPNNSAVRTIVMVRAGTYEENVEIPSEKHNILLIGDGSDGTVIRGSRSVGDGWTTFRSATVGVFGQGFLARDITFQNIAGAAKSQAVALRVNADMVALYRCVIDGYQDTLYVHSFRQFYRECDIHGTVDFLFGNAAVLFQGCKLVAKNPLRGQSNVVAAQSRDDPNEDTGIAIQNCSVLASGELTSSNVSTKTYLGRPWRLYSRTVYIKSYLDKLVDPAGWLEWSGDQGLDTLYFGEYMNSGPGSGTDGRVSWPGYHIMDYDDASNFTVSEFIYGNEWLDSTSFPYDAGI
ncbi:probable pectinesterase/pectinesterase inhibitor 12 [Phoenix dactylifera]|uniref:Probable pectinesterase/pectinesterase inhibitor 12 n=1 Tax=Phoenix dactylifera TaxID=42345 RepID=A0A8B9A043_PHODC|nr:probable pectinesterase/pectinesterase inhibitor 12 [Phoenix dactylifera]